MNLTQARRNDRFATSPLPLHRATISKIVPTLFAHAKEAQVPTRSRSACAQLLVAKARICHGIAIFVEDGFPDLVVVAPGVDDEEIEIVPATMKDDKPESPRFEIVPHQIRAR